VKRKRELDASRSALVELRHRMAGETPPLTNETPADAALLERSELRLRTIADTLPAYAYVDDRLRSVLAHCMYEEQFGTTGLGLG
jgi:hypothetical protein